MFCNLRDCRVFTHLPSLLLKLTQALQGKMYLVPSERELCELLCGEQRALRVYGNNVERKIVFTNTSKILQITTY